MKLAIRVIVQWLKSWFGLSQVSRQMYALERYVNDLERKLHKTENRTDKVLNELDKQRRKEENERMKSDDRERRVREELERERQEKEKLQRTVDMLRDEVKTRDEIVIPNLTEYCEMVHHRFEADSALSAMKTAAASGSNQESGE